MNIQQATDLSNTILQKVGFSKLESTLITQNLVEAELVEKKTHGFVRIPAVVNGVKSGKITVSDTEMEVISQRPASIHFNGNYRPGFSAIYQSLDIAFEKVKDSGILAVGIKDLAYASGFIGDYARRAAEKDLIYIGFHNSPGGLVPFGSTQDLWGTNPITIGIPTHSIPVILDMASSQCTWGDLLVAKTEGKTIQEGVAIDGTGTTTIDPAKAMEGGILPIAEHKGSGLAFIVELLGGGLSNSGFGSAVEGGWGSFYILIDPSIFRDLNSFKDEVQQSIDTLKSSEKAKGVSEIFFPGEQSYYKRQQSLEANEISISDALMQKLDELV